MSTTTTRQGNNASDFSRLSRQSSQISRLRPVDRPDTIHRVVQFLIAACFVLSALLFVRSLPSSWRSFVRASSVHRPQADVSLCRSVVSSRLQTIPIERIQLGDRVAGKNPIREQVERDEPDQVNWRMLTLNMRKEAGGSLRIQLLRPLAWIQSNGVAIGQTFFLNMPEMGAVGEAEVMDLSDCPPIQSGEGTVVTGKFAHQANSKSKVIFLHLEGMEEATGVTSNHPFWSDDRKDYVEVAQLSVGETINTEFGPRRVASLTAYPDYNGLLYNLETLEHVYRVGALGILVHNDCFDYAKAVLESRKSGVVVRMQPTRTPQTGPLPGYPVAGPHGMGSGRSGDHHYFHLEDGVLRDPAHPGGIPITDWINKFNELNEMGPGEIFDFFKFTPNLW